MNNIGTIYLFTKRCILRRFELSDAYNVFYSYSSLNIISKYLNSEAHKNIFETEFMIYEFLKNYDNLNYYNWIIINQMNNEIIGTISLHEVDTYNDKVEIGIIIAPNYQNKGYAKEVIRTIVEFAFNKLKAHRIEAKVMVNNIASNKLFQRLNFGYEGQLHSSIKKNNNYYDVNLYYLLNI